MPITTAGDRPSYNSLTMTHDLAKELVEAGVPILMALAMMFFANRQKLPGLFIAFAVGLVWALAMGLTRGWQVAGTDGLLMLVALAGTLMRYQRLQPR